MNQATIGLFHCGDKGWAEYLKRLLLKDQNIKIEILNLEELVPENPPEVKEVIERSAVTLLLMTPNMCDFIPGKNWLDDTLQEIPEHHTIIDVIAFVDDSEIETIKTGFSSSTKWQTKILSQHTSSNIKMVADIIEMVETSENIKRHQVKEIIPSKIHSPGEKVAIIFETSVSGTVQVSFDDGKNKIDTKRINEATYRFRIPEILPKSKAVNIYMDSVLISTKSIHFIRYGHEVFENIVFLKQCLGVVNDEELDLKLCDIMEKSEPCDGSLSKLFSRECLSAHSSGSSNQSGMYPTILHLAAAYNLKEFTSLLLEAKGALRAFEIKNENNKNPEDLAKDNGHHDLAKYIREFTDTEYAAESCELYVHMSNKTDHPSYLKMDRNIGQEETLDDIYSDASPTLTIITESSIPPTIFPRKNSLPPVPDKAFKQLDSGDLVRPETLRSTIQSMPIPKRSASANPQRHKSDPQLSTILTTKNAKSFLDKPRKFDAGAMGSSSMQELIDVMNLVKTKEFTNEDAEQSLKSWRERPTSRSYRDRKKALAEITGNIYTSKPSKQSLLGRFVKEKKSKRQDKEEWYPVISAPIVEDQFTPNSSTNRASNTSNSSASTFESRDSCLSLSREYSDSEDEKQADASLKQQSVQRRLSGTNTNEKIKRRMSRKDMYLKISLTEEEEPPPPIPPRRKHSVNTGVPIARPPPIVKRNTKNST